jgi:hypothetical protein
MKQQLEEANTCVLTQLDVCSAGRNTESIHVETSGHCNCTAATLLARAHHNVPPATVAANVLQTLDIGCYNAPLQKKPKAM